MYLCFGPHGKNGSFHTSRPTDFRGRGKGERENKDMEDNSIKQILLDAIAKYGMESQERMMVEECAELMNALMKQHRGRAFFDDVITEIADVQIVLWQMMLVYGMDKVNAEIERKLSRLRNRMNNVI